MKKTLALIGIGFGCFNLGIASIFFPVFMIFIMMLFPENINAVLIGDSALCGVIAAIIFIFYSVRRSKAGQTPNSYAWRALVGYELGIIVILIYLISSVISDSSGLGIITGY